MRLKSGSVSYGRRERGQPSAPPSPLEFKVQNNRSVGLPLMQRFWFGRRLILAENASVFPATSLVTVSSLALDKKALLFLPNCSQLGAEDCVEFQTIPFVPVSGWLLITQGLVSLELPALASSQPRPLKHLLAVPKRWPSKGTKPATSFQASGLGQSEVLMGSPQFGGCERPEVTQHRGRAGPGVHLSMSIPRPMLYERHTEILSLPPGVPEFDLDSIWG